MAGIPTRLLKKKEVASLLSVSPRTIDNFCASGKLAYVRLPGGKRFLPEDVETFICSRHSSMNSIAFRQEPRSRTTIKNTKDLAEGFKDKHANHLSLQLNHTEAGHENQSKN